MHSIQSNKLINNTRIWFWTLIFSLFMNLCSFASGSERLELYFLSERILNSKIVPIQTVIQFNNKSRSLGFEGLSAVPKQNYTVAINRSIFPIFAYSDNINGGNLSQTIQIGELTFVGEEDANAKSGLIIGGGAFLGIKRQYGRGKYLNVKINASLAGAPAHDWLQVRSESITTCSKNHIKEWMFFDTCASWAHNKREFSNTINKSILASITRLFRSEKRFHEGSFIVKRVISDNYQQIQSTFTLTSLLPNGFKTNLHLTSGQDVKDFISLNYSAGISVQKLINKKPLSVSLKQTFYDGGMFLGADRQDTTRQISISYPVYNGVNISMGYVKNESTINSFSYSGPLINMSLPSWSF